MFYRPFKNQNRQITLKDFNQPLGLKLNPENKWIKKAAMIPWEAIEKEYADLFPSGCVMPAKTSSLSAMCTTSKDQGCTGKMIPIAAQ